MQEFYIKSKSGPIHCCRWIPGGQPVGIVQIIHGIREYTARYQALALYLCHHGYIVVGADHPGHGHSVKKEVDRGYMFGGWPESVRVVRKLHKHIRKIYPDLPYIMFGHSMGSFLLMTYLSVYDSDLSAAIISGTGWQNETLIKAGIGVCRMLGRKHGNRVSSPVVNRLMFGAYNNKFKPNRSEHDWICSDPAVVDTYASDPLCTWQVSLQLAEEMLMGIQRNQKQENLRKMDCNLPVFFIAGQDDPVGNFGNGVLKTVMEFKKAGMKDVLVELYPHMRHECHNEIGKEKVFSDIVSWISEKR